MFRRLNDVTEPIKWKFAGVFFLGGGGGIKKKEPEKKVNVIICLFQMLFIAS